MAGMVLTLGLHTAATGGTARPLRVRLLAG